MALLRFSRSLALGIVGMMVAAAFAGLGSAVVGNDCPPDEYCTTGGHTDAPLVEIFSYCVDLTCSFNYWSNHELESFTWDFDDGELDSVDPQPTHTFPGEGAYLILLEAVIDGVPYEAGTEVSLPGSDDADWRPNGGVSWVSPDVQCEEGDPCGPGSPPPPCPDCQPIGDDLMIDGYCDDMTCWFSWWGAWSYTLSGFDWDFGDGEGSDWENPEHLYQEQGTYHVTLDWQGVDEAGEPVAGVAHTNVTVPAKGRGYEQPTELYGGTLYGNVTDAAGNPVEGVSLSIWDEGASYDGSSFLASSGYAVTDEQGSYVITGLANGDYGVWVMTDGTPYMPFQDLDFVTISGATEDASTHHQAPVIVLGLGAFFAGQIFDKTVDPRQPVPGGSVSLNGYWIPDGCSGTELTEAEETAALGARFGQAFLDSVRIGRMDCDRSGPGPGRDQTDPAPNSDDGTALTGAGDPGAAPPGPAGYGWDETDSEGHFNVSGLPPGNYMLWVDAPMDQDLPQFYLPFDYFVIVPAEGVDGVVIELGGSGKVTGQAVDGDGNGVSNVWADISPADDATWQSCGDLCHGWDSANDTGHFAIWDIPAGTWTLTIHPPYCCAWDPVTFEPIPQPNWAPVVHTFEHEGGNLDLGAFAFPEARTLTGTILDSDGAPVQAQISVWSRGSSMGGWGESGEDGTYEIPGLLPGTYSIWLWRTDTYGDFRSLDGVEIGEEMTWDYVFRVLGILSGHATADGTPVANAQVGVWCNNCHGWGWAETDSEGFYKMTNLPTGEYSLWAGKHGSGYTWIFEEEIGVVEGETTDKDLLFSPGHTLTGRINDSNGNGVPGAHVNVWGPSGGGWDQTDGNGDYRIEGLGQGEFQVYIYAPYNGGDKDLGDLSTTMTMPAEDHAENFVLAAALTIVGDFMVDGVPCVDCDVSIWNAAGLGACVFTNGNGEFRVPGMAAGSYRVEAYSQQGELLWSGTRTVTADDPRMDIILTTAAKHRVSGAVKDASNNNVPNAVVVALQDGNVMGKTGTGADGTYWLDLAPGTYTLVASSGNRSGNTPITVVDAALTNVNVTISG